MVKTISWTFATSFGHIENVKKIEVKLPKVKETEAKPEGFFKSFFK